MVASSQSRSVAVIGAGGVGGLLAAMLARAGNDVRMLARGTALAQIREHGIRVLGPGEDYTAQVTRASEDPSDLGVADVVLVTVKTWQLAELAPRLAPIVGPHTVVVPLQNGVEASELLASALGEDRVAGAVARVISWSERPGVIRWILPPSLTIGLRRAGADDDLQACATTLRTGGIEVLVSNAIDRARWTKLLFIAPYAAVGAVERTPLGVFRQVPQARARLLAAMAEIAAVAAARGVPLPPDTAAVMMQKLDELPGDATASMHRDIVDGRPSELDELIGAVVRLGREAQVATPVSAALYAELEPLERKARGG
jgi:2-dehydropantoate 2-reductase